MAEPMLSRYSKGGTDHATYGQESLETKLLGARQRVPKTLINGPIQQISRHSKNMDDISPQLVNLGVQLAASAARNTATSITDKIGATRASRSAVEQVAALEQIVSDLLADKNELTRIAQSYQQELVSQQLTPGDVRYIADTVVPLLKQLADGMGGDGGEKLKNQIEALKPLLSVETVNVLQLVGFNFRQGIGAPLTKRAKEAIEGKNDAGSELQIESLRHQRAAMELAADPSAFGRFRELFPGS